MAPQDKVNLNTASEQELQRLQNIGDECARRIIQERERRGGFESISDLDSIGGFGEEAIKSLKNQAYVQ
jgi:competence protein ComEA